MTGPIFDTHAHYSAHAFDADRDFLLGSLPGKGVVGVCEQATHSGVDYHWPVPKDAQLAMFEAHIQLALELDKPIIVHDRNAHADVYALLKKYQPKGIVHCYSGSADDAVWLAKQGLFIGFGGACTFKGAKRAAKAISALPLENIVLETDCPYMAPEPVRGTRCDSSLIRYVGEYIAQLRGISAEEVFRTTAENARRVYGL